MQLQEGESSTRSTVVVVANKLSVSVSVVLGCGLFRDFVGHGWTASKVAALDQLQNLHFVVMVVALVVKLQHLAQWTAAIKWMICVQVVRLSVPHCVARLQLAVVSGMLTVGVHAQWSNHACQSHKAENLLYIRVLWLCAQLNSTPFQHLLAICWIGTTKFFFIVIYSYRLYWIFLFPILLIKNVTFETLYVVLA